MPPKKEKTKGEAKTEEKEEMDKERQEREAAEAAEQEEIERQEAKAKEVEENKKAAAKKDYESHLADVEELKEMTDTSAWKKYYSGLRRDVEKAGKMVLDVEKTREIIRFQETVKVIRKIMARVRGPVDDMNAFCEAHPLFVAQFPVRAAWNSATGTVELSGQKPKK